MNLTRIRMAVMSRWLRYWARDYKVACSNPLLALPVLSHTFITGTWFTWLCQTLSWTMQTLRHPFWALNPGPSCFDVTVLPIEPLLQYWETIISTILSTFTSIFALLFKSVLEFFLIFNWLNLLANKFSLNCYLGRILFYQSD